jgi:DNA-directed RNA polymerase subunit K/omega
MSDIDDEELSNDELQDDISINDEFELDAEDEEEEDEEEITPSSAQIITDNRSVLKDDICDVVVVPPGQGRTPSVMSIYELAQVLAIRTTQIASGAPTMLDHKTVAGLEPDQIAERELESRCIPLIIRRRVSATVIEEHRVSDMAAPQIGLFTSRRTVK